jgi:hypothetical protein
MRYHYAEFQKLTIVVVNFEDWTWNKCTVHGLLCVDTACIIIQNAVDQSQITAGFWVSTYIAHVLYTHVHVRTCTLS